MGWTHHRTGEARVVLKRQSIPITSIGLWCAAAAMAQDPFPDEAMWRDFGLLPVASTETDPVPVTWDGDPIPVTLDVGEERRLIFPEPFRLGLEPAVSAQFTHEIYDRYLLLRARKPLSTRARVQLASGTMLLLDLHVVTGSGLAAAPIEFHLPDPDPTTPASPPVESLPAGLLGSPVTPPSYIELVRFAAQRLYAPARLQPERPGWSSQALEPHPLRLLRGAPVLASPIATWGTAGRYVTAVRLQNEWNQPLVLDPRQLVGRWRAAAFHVNRLPPQGETTLYLVSDTPFDQALGWMGDLRRDVDGIIAAPGADRGGAD